MSSDAVAAMRCALFCLLSFFLNHNLAFVLDKQNPYSQFRKWNAGLNGTLELEFKTDQPNGLLLYTDDSGTYDFFELKLVNGALRLRYNLGGGAQIITVGNNLNDGHWHKIQVARRDEHTSLGVDGAALSKASRGKEFAFGRFTTNSDVFVGGIPPSYNSKLTTLALPSVIFEPKFRGAVRNLVYSDLPGQPPRRQELRHSRDLKSSRSGNASGDACERRDPCQHGGVCISTDDGPVCECRDADYEGAFCERDKAPSEATFRGAEFLSYDLTQTGGEPIVSTQDTISLYFKTRQPNGLLFYTGHEADYLNLAVRDGGVSLTMGLGNGKQEMHIKPAKTRFDDHQWHKLTVHRRIQEITPFTSFCRVSAIVDDVYWSRAHAAGGFTLLASSRAHVGGSLNARALPGARVHTNFVGCLKKVEFSADTLRLNLIDLARTGSKLIAVTGRLEYACTAVDSADPVTFTTRDAHLILPKWEAVKTGTISFKFRTNEPNGLILFNMGAKPPRADLFAVEMLNGYIYVHMDLGSGGVRVRASRRRVDDSHWHEFLLRRTGRDGRVTVDGANAEFKTPGESNQLELDGSLFVGGLGSEYSASRTPPALWTAALRQGFVGCMRELVLNGKPQDLTAYARQQDSVGVLSRQGFEGCIASLDLPGESPSLMEDAVVPSSSLMSGCEGPTKCTHNACANKGVCVQQWNTYACDCDLTSFTGPTCYDESIAYEFGPGRGIITYTFPPSAVADTEADRLALGFLTSKADAVLLRIESSNTQDYLQMEIIRGNVFTVYNVGGGDHPLGDEAARVDDGAYHVLRFTRNGSQAALQLDNYAVNIRHPQGGQQSTIFNSMSTITVGGGAGGARSFSGVMAGLVVNGVRVLDLAASGDPAVSVRGDARRASSPLDRDINRMQQTPPSGYAGPGVMDELVYSGAGSGCRDDDEDACVLPDAGSGDDLITPVYVPSTRRPPLRGGYKGDTSGKLMKPCDDEDCIEGSGSSGEDVTEPDHPTTTSGASSTHSMTSITTAGISSTHHEEKAVSSTTVDLTTGGRPTDRQTTAPDHDNMHAGTHPVAGEEKRTTPIDENTYTEHQYTPTVTKHTPDESTHTTEEEIHHIPEYEDRHEHENEIDTRTSTYELEGEQDRIPGKVHPDYNGFEHDTSTKWYHPKTTDNRVVPPESEFFATIVGIVASVLIAIILVVIIVLKYVVFRLDPSYKVTEGKGYQQGASAALLGNQAHSSYQSGAGAPTGGAVRNLQPLPLNRNGSTPSAPLPTQPTKRDGIKEWYV